MSFYRMLLFSTRMPSVSDFNTLLSSSRKVVSFSLLTQSWPTQPVQASWGEVPHTQPPESDSHEPDCSPAPTPLSTPPKLLKLSLGWTLKRAAPCFLFSLPRPCVLLFCHAFPSPIEGDLYKQTRLQPLALRADSVNLNLIKLLDTWRGGERGVGGLWCHVTGSLTL